MNTEIKEQTMDRRMLSEQMIGHRTKLRRKTRDIWRKRRSKGVLVVVRSQKGPSYGHQTLRRSHRNRIFRSLQFNSTFIPLGYSLYSIVKLNSTSHNISVFFRLIFLTIQKNQLLIFVTQSY